MASICTTPKHRKLLLQVLQRLSFEDTASLIYLSGNIVGLPVDSSRAMLQGIKLFAELEGRGMLGDGNYTFLAECLEAIGRNDLAVSIAESTAHSLPCVPPSFQTSGQMVFMKHTVFKSKYSQFRTQMSHLVTRLNNHKLCEQSFEGICSAVQSGCLLKTLDLESHNSTIIFDTNLVSRELKSGLTELSFFWKIFPSALTTMNQSRSIEQALPFMQQWHSHFSRFEQTLTNSPWMPSAIQQEFKSSCSQQDENAFWSMVHGAWVFLYDAISALASSQEIVESSKQLEQVICTLESMNTTEMSSRFSVISHWLLTVIHQLQAGIILKEGEGIRDLITHLVEEHKEDMKKYHHLLTKVVGIELLHRAGVVPSDQDDKATAISEENTCCSKCPETQLGMTGCALFLWHTSLLVLFSFVTHIPCNQDFTQQLEAILTEQFVYHGNHMLSDYIHHSDALGFLLKEAFRRSKEQAIEHLLRDIQDQKASARQTMHQLLDYEEELEQISSDLTKTLRCSDEQ